MSLNRILIPVEDRDLTHALVAYLLPLLQAEGRETSLLRVIPPGDKDLAARGAHVRAARDDLSQVCDTIRAQGVRVTADWVEAAGPAGAIIARAAAWRASLIVQATHARGDVTRWVRGSVTEQVLRESTTPLLLFNPWNEVSRFERILVACDGSEPATRVVPQVVAFAQQFGSEVTLLRAGPPPGAEGVRVSDLEESLEECRAYLAAAGVASRSLIVPGLDVSQAILDVAKREGSDLIAMTREGSGQAPWPYASTAEQVFRTSPLPLLIHPVTRLELP